MCGENCVIEFSFLNCSLPLIDIYIECVCVGKIVLLNFPFWLFHSLIDIGIWYKCKYVVIGMRWVFPLFLFQMPQDIQRQTHTVFYALFIKNLISLFRFCWVEDTITLRYFWVFGFTFDFLSFSFRLFRFVSVFPFWVWFDFLKTKKPITTTTNPKRKTSKKRYNFQLL